MRFLPLALLSLVFVSCAHKAEAPRTVQFPYAEELLQKIQAGTSRAPASLDQAVNEKSPRRVYFSALYHQYLTLGSHLGKLSAVKSCPQFHHDKLATDQRITPQVTFYQPKHIQEEGRVFFPELAFSKDFSLADYHEEMSQEIFELCEAGVSDNFFKFDNLVTHYSGKTSFHKNPRAMASVLKIPVFANFYLVKMLEVPGKHFSPREERDFIALARTDWFENYVAEARGLRNSYIKNKMVRR